MIGIFFEHMGPASAPSIPLTESIAFPWVPLELHVGSHQHPLRVTGIFLKHRFLILFLLIRSCSSALQCGVSSTHLLTRSIHTHVTVLSFQKDVLGVWPSFRSLHF